MTKKAYASKTPAILAKEVIGNVLEFKDWAENSFENGEIILIELLISNFP